MTHKLLSWHSYDGGFWFRVLGYGISIKDTKKHQLLFSERNGYQGAIRIGKYSIKYLPKHT